MRSDAQLTRLLRLVPYLAANQGVSVDEAAAAFTTTPKQIVRDLEVLQFCGLPGGYFDDLFDVDIDAVREEGHIDFRNADVLARPLRLRPDEAASLLAALRLVVEVAGGSEAALSALHKLEAAVEDGADGLSVAVAPTDPEHRSALTAAAAGHRVVRLTYRAGGRTGTTVADVEPARVRLVDGFAYLDAWSRSRGAWRSFRLDRVEAVETLAEEFSPRGDPPEGWFDDVARQLTLTVTRRAAWIAEYYPTTSVEPDGDALRVTFPVASPDWAAALVLRLGDAVLDVSDDAVSALARERAAAALALYPEEPAVGFPA